MCFHLYYLHFCISLYTCANVICIKLLLTYLLAASIRCSSQLHLNKDLLRHGSVFVMFKITSSQLVHVVVTRHLRSAAHGDLQVLACRTSTFGPRSFAACAPKLWNWICQSWSPPFSYSGWPCCSTTLQNNEKRPKMFCCFWPNTLKFTPIDYSWSITDTDSVLCASEDCVIL